MEAQDQSPLRLSEEQVTEVKHRLADKQPRFLTLAEARARLLRSGA
jgi:hypothetical protein